MRRRVGGFTLIEVLVVLSLLGVLMGLSIGFVQRAGRGNLLIQTTNAFANQLASARARSYGNNRAYVLVQVEDGKVSFRAYRDRQVFHWACEDFDRTSELGVLDHEGGVTISTPDDGRIPSREGRHAVFAGGKVTVADKPWLRWIEGFSIACRLNPDASASGLSGTVLFEKGQALQVKLVRDQDGRFDVVARVGLAPDKEGRGGGWYEVQTGRQDEGDVPEWRGPVLSGRWSDVRIAYDRNVFTIHVNDRLRGSAASKRNTMKPDDPNANTPLVIGTGYQGGFDSLLIGGIYEDDDDRYDLADSVLWIDDQGKPIETTEAVHFRNLNLDPTKHTKPVRFTFRLDEGQQEGARRIVEVSLSGEARVLRPGE